MESTTYLNRLIAGLLLGLSACHGDAQSQQQPKLSYTLVRTPHLPDSALFQDTAGKLCIRLPYRYVHEDISQNPLYDFVYCVGAEQSYECLPLDQVLDVASFRRVARTDNYWQDKRNIYADPWVPYPAQYFFRQLGRVGQVSFLVDPNFARSHGRLYYRGVHVPGDTIPKSGHYP